MTATEPTTDGSYRDRIVAVEPGGNEFIAEADRHGKPSQLFWTWTSPNLEFATIFVGVLAVAVYGMSFWQAVVGIVVGTGLGALAHYFLSARGPLHGVPQMVLGRLPFGFKGNAVPAVLMAVTAGVGWFATNSVSGAIRAGRTVRHRAAGRPGDHRAGADRVRVLRAQPGAGLRALVVSGARGHLRGRVGGDPRPSRTSGHPRSTHRRRRLDGRLPADGRHRLRLRGGLDAVRRGLHALPAVDRVDGAHRPVRLGRPVPVVRGVGGRRRGIGDDRPGASRRIRPGVHRRAGVAARPRPPCWPSRSVRSRPTRSTSIRAQWRS